MGVGSDLHSIVDPAVDPELEWGRELRDLATALTTGEGVEESGKLLAEAAGREVAAAAVGVCANFEMMNRILDGIGCPVPAFARPIAKQLGVEPAH